MDISGGGAIPYRILLTYNTLVALALPSLVPISSIRVAIRIPTLPHLFVRILLFPDDLLL
jgi:hypothetical protein